MEFNLHNPVDFVKQSDPTSPAVPGDLADISGDMARFMSVFFDPEDIIVIRPVWSGTDKNGEDYRAVDYKGIRYHRARDLLNHPKLWEAILKDAKEKKTNLYFGANPRFGKGGYDLSSQIRKVNCFYTDLDNCTSEEVLQRCVAADVPPPTGTILSGRGNHCYWKLAEPYFITDASDPPRVHTEFWEDDDGKKKAVKYIEVDGQRVYENSPGWPKLSDQAKHFQRILKGLCIALNADHAHDLARLLRIPGSWNRKSEYEGKTPTPCMIHDLDPTRQYTMEDFERFAVPPEAPAVSQDGSQPAACGGPSAEASAGAAPLPPTKLEDREIVKLLRQDPKYDALWYGSTAGYPSASEADLALTSKLAFYCGNNPERITALLWNSNLRRVKWKNHKTYLRDTVDKALAGKTTFYRGPAPIDEEKEGMEALEKYLKQLKQGKASRQAQEKATPGEALATAWAAKTSNGVPRFNARHEIPDWLEFWIEGGLQNLEAQLTNGNCPDMADGCFGPLFISRPGFPEHKRQIHPPCRKTKHCDFCWVDRRMNEYRHCALIAAAYPTMFVSSIAWTKKAQKAYRKAVKATGKLRGVEGYCRYLLQNNDTAFAFSNVDTPGAVPCTFAQFLSRLQFTVVNLKRHAPRRTGGSNAWTIKPKTPQGFKLDLTLNGVDPADLQRFFAASKNATVQSDFITSSAWAGGHFLFRDYVLDRRYISNYALAWSNVPDHVDDWIVAGKPASYTCDLFQPGKGIPTNWGFSNVNAQRATAQVAAAGKASGP